MRSRIPPHAFDSFDPTGDSDAGDVWTQRARAEQAHALAPRPGCRRAFLCYLDGEPVGLRAAVSGKAAEARERAAQRVPAGEAFRVRAVWVPAAPRGDLAALLRAVHGVHSGE